VLTILDMKAEFAKLRMLRGRTPETPEAERDGAFARLAPYRDSAINVAKFSGEGPWERHIYGDEIVQVVDGATTFHIMTDDGPQSYALKAGMVVIVPQGAWHRFEAPDGVSLMTTPPQPTQHLTSANPRMTAGGYVKAGSASRSARHRMLLGTTGSARGAEP
jgi:mannose-6-phosphate isomerase-like protein (cupin superfamily)